MEKVFVQDNHDFSTWSIHGVGGWRNDAVKGCNPRSKNRIASFWFLWGLRSAARLRRRRRQEGRCSIVLRSTSRCLGHHSHRALGLGGRRLQLWRGLGTGVFDLGSLKLCHLG